MLSRLAADTLAEQWTRSIDTDGTDVPGGVAFYAHRLYVTGSTTAPLTAKPIRGASDFFVAAFKDSGVPVWQRQFGTMAADPAPSVAATPDGPLVAATVNRPDQPVNSSTTDAAVYFYARNGDLREQRRLGGSAYDGAAAADWNFHGLRVARRDHLAALRADHRRAGPVPDQLRRADPPQVPRAGGERGGPRLGQLAPQREAAARHAAPPLRQLAREGGDQGVALLTQPRPVLREDRLGVASSRVSTSCSSTGPPRSTPSRASASSSTRPARRPQPAQAQPAPEALLALPR